MGENESEAVMAAQAATRLPGLDLPALPTGRCATSLAQVVGEHNRARVHATTPATAAALRVQTLHGLARVRSEAASEMASTALHVAANVARRMAELVAEAPTPALLVVAGLRGLSHDEVVERVRRSADAGDLGAVGAWLAVWPHAEAVQAAAARAIDPNAEAGIRDAAGRLVPVLREADRAMEALGHQVGEPAYVPADLPAAVRRWFEPSEVPQ